MPRETGTTRDHQGGGVLSEEDLRAVAADVHTEITVFGCGGAGSNAITRMYDNGVEDLSLVAANTDARHLQAETRADVKILLGEGTSRGRGAGSVPKVGRNAAHESLADIEAAVQNQDLVFVTAGLGGGTGTGAAPVVAECASKHGALTISVVTIPFTAEGQRRRDNATGGLEQLERFSDTLLVIQNDRILDYAPELPLRKAFELCDGVLINSVSGISDLITKSSLVNVDFADVRTIMDDGGVGMIGIGEGSGDGKAREATAATLQSPLLDVDVSNAGAALVHVVGGRDMTVDEAEDVVERIYERVDPAAEIIWGASIDPEMEDTMQVMLSVADIPDPDPTRSLNSQTATDDIDHIMK